VYQAAALIADRKTGREIQMLAANWWERKPRSGSARSGRRRA